MRYYSFENTESGDDGRYDLFAKTTVNIESTNLQQIIVTDEYKGKLHLVCKYLYGNTDFLEELMTINNIINPFSIKTGSIIRYFENISEYEQLYQRDPINDSNKDEILLMNKNKTTKKDKNRIGSPPTIKPDSISQINVDKKSRKISIINKFK